MIVTVKNEVNRARGQTARPPEQGLAGALQWQYKRQDKNRFFEPEIWAIPTCSRRSRARIDPFAFKFARRMGTQTDTLQWRHVYCSLYIYYEHRIARATLERARARASSHERAAEWGTFVSFFFFRLYTKLKHDHSRTTIHDFNLHQ